MRQLRADNNTGDFNTPARTSSDKMEEIRKKLEAGKVEKTENSQREFEQYKLDLERRFTANSKLMKLANSPLTLGRALLLLWL